MSMSESPEVQRLRECVDRFSTARVLVVGDIILDEYVWGDVSRISPEAPVPVVDVRDQTRVPGGAANVVVNMATLGARPLLCGVIGQDTVGDQLLGFLERTGLSTAGVFRDPTRPTSIKTRVIAHHQQVVRFDCESRKPVGPENIGKILEFASRHLSGIDAVVISDYGKGVVSAPLMSGMKGLAAKRPVRIAVDPKPGNFEHYRGVDVITPNHHEAGRYCGFEIVDRRSLDQAGRRMLAELACGSVLITQGKEGMTLFENSGAIVRIPTVARKVFDVTGAGDTVIGTFSLGLATGMDLKSAALLSNVAAGIVVGEVGTSAVKAEELKRAINGATLGLETAGEKPRA